MDKKTRCRLGEYLSKYVHLKEFEYRVYKECSKLYNEKINLLKQAKDLSR